MLKTFTTQVCILTHKNVFDSLGNDSLSTDVETGLRHPGNPNSTNGYYRQCCSYHPKTLKWFELTNQQIYTWNWNCVLVGIIIWYDLKCFLEKLCRFACKYTKCLQWHNIFYSLNVCESGNALCCFQFSLFLSFLFSVL